MRSTVGDARLVVVAQAGVGGVEQRAGPLEVAVRERGGHRLDAGVLGDHVAGALAQRVLQARQVLRARLPERLDPERRAGRLALGAALVVARGGEGVAGAGVERDEPPVAEVERDRRRPRASGSRSAARAPARDSRRGELVEQAGLLADPLVLHPRAQLGELAQVLRRRLAGQPEQGQAERRRRSRPRSSARCPAGGRR